MKTTFSPITTTVIAVAALATGASTLQADDNTKTSRHHHHATTQKAHAAIPTQDDRNAREVTGGATGGANGPEYRVRTGSHIPEHYNRRGYTTDSQDDEFIYDRNDIRLQSTNDVGDSLRQVPGVSVGGRR